MEEEARYSYLMWDVLIDGYELVLTPLSTSEVNFQVRSISIWGVGVFSSLVVVVVFAVLTVMRHVSRI